MSSVPAQTARSGSTFWSIMTVLVVLLLVVAVVSRLAIDYGLYTPEWMKPALTPQPTPTMTVRVLPTPALLPVVMPDPTALPVPPTALPVGQPAVAPAILPGANEAATHDVGPATIKTRAPVCFGGWWYVGGQNTKISCSGTGGD